MASGTGGLAEARTGLWVRGLDDPSLHPRGAQADRAQTRTPEKECFSERLSDLLYEIPDMSLITRQEIFEKSLIGDGSWPFVH